MTKTARYRIFAVLIGCVVAVILSEFLLRLVGPHWLKRRMFEVGVENRTGITDTAFGSDADWPVERYEGEFLKFTPLSTFRVKHYEYDVEVHIDGLGGRATKSAGATNGVIPCFGDSFTFGVGVEDDETWVSSLGSEIPSQLINLGVPGSCLADHLDILELRHEELGSPRLYIFSVFIGNDLTNLLTRGATPDEATQLMPLRHKRSTRLLQAVNDLVRNNPLLRRIYLIQFAKSRLLVVYNRSRAARGVVQRMDDEIFHVIREDQHFLDMMSLHERQLERLTEISEEKKFRSIFVLIPDRHQVDRELLDAKCRYYGLAEDEVDIDLANRHLRAQLDAYHIPYVDVLDCLREEWSRNGDDPLYFTLDNHLTAHGHRAAFECMKGPMKRMVTQALTDEKGLAENS